MSTKSERTVPAYFVAMGGRDVRIVLAGASVITGEDEDAVVQRFDSPKAAREHLDLVLRRHRRQGFAISERQVAVALDPGGEVDDLVGVVQWEADQLRMTVTLREPDDVRRCADIVARAGELAAEWMQVICDPESPGRALAGAVARRPLPALRCLAFDTHFQTVTRQQDNDPGPLHELLSGLPGLTRLFATGSLNLRPLAHERLEELYLLGDPLSVELLAALGRCRLPALEVLALCLAHDAEAPDSRAAAGALHALHAPALAHLEVAGVDDLREFLDALTARPLPPSWQTLRVSGVVADEDELLPLLAERAPRLAGLAQLGLPLDELSHGAAEQARRLVPELEDPDEMSLYLDPSSYRSE
jgi:hypothetical protein